MQVGFYFDQTRCTGCGACQVACKDWHDVPAGPEKWARMLYREKGMFPRIFVSYLPTMCWHCHDPVCVPVCPVKAITKREKDGIVVTDSDVCVGKESCGAKCLKACPYDAPQFTAPPEAKMRKCNFCLDRWQEGKLPVCVEACPTRALDAGELETLKGRYGNGKEAEAFTYSERVKPAVIFRKKER